MHDEIMLIGFKFVCSQSFQNQLHQMLNTEVFKECIIYNNGKFLSSNGANHDKVIFERTMPTNPIWETL